MSNIATQIFAGSEINDPILAQQGFLVIHKFTDSTTPSTSDIDQNIYISSLPTNVLVFSPKGNIYFTSADKNGNLNKDYDETKSFINSITGNTESYRNSYMNWRYLDYKKFSAYNNEISFPQFFTSITGDLGNGVYGSGYILYRDFSYTFANSSTSSYYLLYNPFDRLIGDGLAINNQPKMFSRYCSAIDYQDEACYCRNDSNNRCLYAVANSETNGKAILSSGLESGDPGTAQAYNSLIATCGCNSVCQKWLGRSNLATSLQPVCSASTSNVFCGVSLTADQKSAIETSGLNISQNCSNSDSNKSVPPPSSPTHSSVLPVIGIIVILLLICTIFFLKK